MGEIDWSIGATDCAVSDYTSLNTTMNAGEAVAMEVETGVWCGCAVWVDLDNNGAFEETENLYYGYTGGDPSYIYDFNLTIPPGTPSGPHRMRVIAPWGSDGFLSTNTNGFGPCGDFQYGNFDDFTIIVSGTEGMVDPPEEALPTASPNPTAGPLLLQGTALAPVEHVVVRSLDGRTMLDRSFAPSAEPVQLDLSAFPGGVYGVQCVIGGVDRTLRVVKQ